MEGRIQIRDPLGFKARVRKLRTVVTFRRCQIIWEVGKFALSTEHNCLSIGSRAETEKKQQSKHYYTLKLIDASVRQNTPSLITKLIHCQLQRARCLNHMIKDPNMSGST